MLITGVLLMMLVNKPLSPGNKLCTVDHKESWMVCMLQYAAIYKL